MKSSFKTSFLILGLCASPAYALNPINGWYAGITLGGSYTPSTDLYFSLPNTANSDACQQGVTCNLAYGKLKFSAFGNIGGQVGIRKNHFRLEFEPLYNYNPYQTIKLNGVEFKSSKSSTSLRFQGNTTTGLFLVNGFYDFFTYGSESGLVPYVGAGVGYAYIKNTLRFYCNNQEIACSSISETSTSPAVQGILGAAYFADDFTWFGLDFRYITTKKIDIFNTRPQIATINLSVNGLFNCA